MNVIGTGYPALDEALGIGGLPRGYVVEVFGPEKSGKTALVLRAIAECQRAGGMAAFVDAEHALEVAKAAELGVSLEKLLVSQPDNAEQGLEIVEVLARSGAVDLIVVDSVAALVPRAEVEGESGDQHVGLQARLMGQALRKLTAIAHRTGTCIVFVNQLRMRIGVTFGSHESATGGNALKFYSAMRLDVRQLERGRARVKVVKNKLAVPFTQAEIDLYT